MTEPLISVQDVHKYFGQKHILKGVNMEVEAGQSLVILGGSGAGKSVLLRHLVGLHTASKGEVLIEGKDIAKLNRKGLYAMRRRFGMSFQEGALFDSMTVFENIAFPLRRHLRKAKQADIKARVQECLDIVGMPTVGPLFPSELSGGMRRRVGFARTIALKPEILLFDEPTTGLDPIMTSIVGEVIIHMREKLKATTITITHDIRSAKAIATHVAMIFQGEIILSAEKDTFFQSEHPIVRQFLEGRAEGPATQALLK
jgi:phospholipid/cholesterol/gamma-HCH transport system ATP-binding protein